MKYRLRISVLLAAAAVLFLSGCREDSEHKAAKQARRASEKALAILKTTGDKAAAQKELQKALSAQTRTGSAKQIAVLMSANLIFDEAEQLQAEMPDRRQKLANMADKIHLTTGKIKELQLEQYHLTKLLAAGDNEVTQIKNILTKGGDQAPALKTQLADYKRQLEELHGQKEVLQGQADYAQKQAAELQRQANDLLRQANYATMDERTRLERQAFQLLLGSSDANEQPLLGKTAWLRKAQEAIDQIDGIESKLAVVGPRIEKLAADIAAGEKRIEDIETSTGRRQMRTRLRGIKSKIAGRQQQIRKPAGQLETAGKNYHDEVTKIVDLLGQAGKEYKKITTSSNKAAAKIARMAEADCSLRIGHVCTDYMKLQKRFGARLKLLVENADSATAQQLNRLTRRYTAGINNYSRKAMENYDSAIEAYDKLQKLARRKKDALAGSVIKNHILALYAKARLAQQTGKEHLKNRTMEQLQALAERASEYDPDFEKSVTAALLRDLK